MVFGNRVARRRACAYFWVMEQAHHHLFETAIGLWNLLIATPINQLTAYHGAGIKSEQVAALIVQLLTFGSIGVGVNR